jgi:hypothetical protein
VSERWHVFSLQPLMFLLSEGLDRLCAGDVIGTDVFTDLCAHVSKHKPVKSFVPIEVRRDRSFSSRTTQGVVDHLTRGLKRQHRVRSQWPILLLNEWLILVEVQQPVSPISIRSNHIHNISQSLIPRAREISRNS